MTNRVGWMTRGSGRWLLALAFTPGAAWACGGTSHSDDPEPSAAGAAGAAATSAGAGAAVAGERGGGAASTGGSNQGGAGATGRAGAATAGSAAGGVSGAGISGSGGASAGGAGAGAGGAANEPCNDLELVELAPTCTQLIAPPAAQGGVISAGTYALSSYQLPICFNGLEQTLRLTSTAPDTFETQAVINLSEARANAEMVLEGTTLRSTSTCGANEPSEAYGYSTYEQQGERYLVLSHETEGVFTYRRVGD